MKLVDSSVIFEPVEFIFNVLNVFVAKHFFVLSYESVKFIPNVGMCMCAYEYICLCVYSCEHVNDFVSLFHHL